MFSLRQSPRLLWQQGKVGYLQLTYLGMRWLAPRWYPSLFPWVLKERRWQTLKLVAAWSWVDDHGWLGSHHCCGFCSPESNEVVQSAWHNRDNKDYQTLSRWWAKEVTVPNNVSVGSLNEVPCVSPEHSWRPDPQDLPMQHLGKGMFCCCLRCCLFLMYHADRIPQRGSWL